MKEYIYEMPRDDYDNMFSDKAGNPTVENNIFTDMIQVKIPFKLQFQKN